MCDYPGKDVASLRILATALAKEAFFGRDELSKKKFEWKEEYRDVRKT